MAETRENHGVIFLSRPGVNGEPKEENFGYVSQPYPSEELTEGQVLLKTLYLSVDPAQRCQMNEDTGASYLKPFEIGKVITGLGGIGVVLKSNDIVYKEGDVVVSRDLGWPWQKYTVMDGRHLLKVEQSMVGDHLSLMISCLGLVGLTALIGIKEKGGLQPDKDQTCVVSAAAGACGTLAGQIARLEGASTVVGICGADKKCQMLTQDLGFCAAINYKKEDVTQRLKECCPRGVDCYFDNVGGDISSKVIKQMNRNSHVVLCGQVSQYNKDVPYPPPIPEDIQIILKERNITRERFLVLNYQSQFQERLMQLAALLKQGKIQVKETLEEGLENTGRAFVKMMKGENMGKQIVHVADL